MAPSSSGLAARSPRLGQGKARQCTRSPSPWVAPPLHKTLGKLGAVEIFKP